MGDKYTVQFQLEDKVYEDWKRYLSGQGYLLHRGSMNIKHINCIAMQYAIKQFMKDKKLLKEHLGEPI